ncbi:DNA polymerase III subunit delta [Rhizohabitans arisaemae]|uniref:DNA polymerase III subunit delta n=1 Tax=Rhizohabitans arisaemae TaxID=2720610 RepID=UPI0024B2426D|nr:DNA polymerase III subunit delta [Rhizohabitans arisaemae]
MLHDVAAETHANVTLIMGEEEFLADRAVAEVRAAVPGAEVHDLVGGKVEPGDLARLTSPSLFGDRSLVVIRAAQDIPKEVVPEVVAYAGRPPEDALVVLVHPGGVKGKALVDGVKKAGAAVVAIPKVTKAGERIAFIRSEMRRAGRSIGEDAARTLLDAVGNDLRELAAACSQLALDSDAKTVDEATVLRYHRGRAEVTGFAISDLAVEGKLGEALEQLRWAIGTGVAPVLIISALSRGLRSLAKVSGGQREAQAGMPPWMVDKLRKQLRGWGPEGLSAAIQAVTEADAQVKGAGADPAYALERAVQTIVVSRHGR